MVIEMNAAALAAIGLDREDVVGRPFADMPFWKECNWRGADLAQVVRRTLTPYAGVEGSRCTISGPVVFLQPRAALTLGMIVHELATKYGSLSVPAGRLDVTWSSHTLSGEVVVQLI